MLTQGDTLYDVVDKRDFATIRSHLTSDVTSPRQSDFFVRMNVARSLRRQSGFGDYKVVLTPLIHIFMIFFQLQND